MYVQMRKSKNLIKNKYLKIGKNLIAKRVLKSLHREAELQRRCKFMSLRQINGLKMRCLAAISENAIESGK